MLKNKIIPILVTVALLSTGIADAVSTAIGCATICWTTHLKYTEVEPTCSLPE